ncbi:MAG: hypothetical protein V4550_18675 [Gemmatimonadota bacterium]
MLIHDLRVRASAGGAEISANIDTERVTLRYSESMPLVSNGDAFVAIALGRAMERGETLHVSPDIPVSARLLWGLATYQDVYVDWWPHLHLVKIDAPAATQSSTPGTRVGCFFSGGVDSLYTFIRHREEIDDLILCRGLEIAHDETERWKLAVEAMARFAADAGKRLVCIDTDAKKRFQCNRNINYGAILIGAAIPLGYERLIVPSGSSYRNPFPWGTHPLIDPLLSTDTTFVIHDGAASRADKTQLIAATRIGLDSLRVCNRSAAYNCGVCEKCLRTMSALASLATESKMLPPFDPGALRSLRLENLLVVGFWRENLALAQSRGQNHHARAIAALLAKHERRKRLRSIDERWLGSAGVHLLRMARRVRGRLFGEG